MRLKDIPGNAFLLRGPVICQPTLSNSTKNTRPPAHEYPQLQGAKRLLDLDSGKFNVLNSSFESLSYHKSYILNDWWCNQISTNYSFFVLFFSFGRNAHVKSCVLTPDGCKMDLNTVRLTKVLIGGYVVMQYGEYSSQKDMD